jgi:hypothetical protein
MPNHQVITNISEKEILDLLEKHLGVKFKEVSWEISESGDHDRGTYKKKVKNLEVISEEIPINSTYK